MFVSFNFFLKMDSLTKENVFNSTKKFLMAYGPSGLYNDTKMNNSCERTVLSMSQNELNEMGFSEVASIKLNGLAQFVAHKYVSNETPQTTQKKSICCKDLPPFWIKATAEEKMFYFSTLTLKCQTKEPGATASEINCYNACDVAKFLKCIEFQQRAIGKDIFDAMEKEAVTGDRLLALSYKNLISMGISDDEAKKLRRDLISLQKKDSFMKLDEDDIRIWAQMFGVGTKGLGVIKKHGITGKKLLSFVDLSGSLKMIGLTEGDTAKIVEAVRNINYEEYKELTLIGSVGAYTELGMRPSPLFSLDFDMLSNYKTLAEAVEEAGFTDDKSDMLANAKKKWESDQSDDIKGYGLTEEEAAAIYVYTYDFGEDNLEKKPFRVVNKTLAERNVHKLNHLSWYILHLLSALRKLPRYPVNKVLYRGVKGPVSPALREEGAIASWPAFTSTTVSKDIGRNFADPKDPVLFEIHGTFYGYDISPFSAMKEGEVLLEPDTVFKVKEIGEDDKFPGVTRVIVEAINDSPVIEEMVIKFNKEKSKRASEGDGIANWPLEEAVSMIKVSAFEMLKAPLPCCSFREAFERAGFGCTYMGLMERLMKIPINKERRLSDVDALTVFSYTVEDGGDLKPYRVVNKTLAERNVKSAMVYPYIFHLLHALRKLPSYSGSGTLYRGIDGKMLNSATHQIGNTLTWPAFTSTTYDKKKAYDFVKRESIKTKIVFKINGVVRGYSISDCSMFPNECEVLLEPENKFIITNIGPDPENTSVTVISVNVIETPPIVPDLIEVFGANAYLVDGWTAFKHPETGELLYLNDVTLNIQRECPGKKVSEDEINVSRIRQLQSQGQQNKDFRAEIMTSQQQNPRAEIMTSQQKQQQNPRAEIMISQQQQNPRAEIMTSQQQQNPRAEIITSQQTKEDSRAEIMTSQQTKEDSRAEIMTSQQQQQQQSKHIDELPPNWERRVDQKTGRVYYANKLTKTTQWMMPTN